jgi:hypothetical protein
VAKLGLGWIWFGKVWFGYLLKEESFGEDLLWTESTGSQLSLHGRQNLKQKHI